MNRRRFIQTAAALFCAPAIVKAENIMRINPDLVLPKRIPGSVDVYVSDWDTHVISPNPEFQFREWGDGDAFHGEVSLFEDGQLFRKSYSVHAAVSPEGLRTEITYQQVKRANEIVMDLVYKRHNGADGWRNDYLQNKHSLIAKYLGGDLNHASR